MKQGMIYLFFLLISNMLSYSQLNINPHEFNIVNWSIIESCNPCHIYSDKSDQESKGNFMLAFDSDSGNTIANGYISGISKLCYSCHDGTVASFSHADESLGNGTPNNLMTLNHPVSVKYNITNKANRLHDPEITKSELGGTIAEDMLVNGRVECTSCHDPHFMNQSMICQNCPSLSMLNNASPYLSLLKSNKASELCLTCHKL